MTLRRPRRATALVVATLALGACQLVLGGDDLTFGHPCQRSSDCPSAAERCIFGFCGLQCKAEKDCADGERCVQTANADACVATEHGTCTSDVDCDSASSPARPVTCSGGRCRDVCNEMLTCVSGQVCQGAVCIGTDQTRDPDAAGGASSGGTAGSEGQAGDAGSSGAAGHSGTDGTAGMNSAGGAAGATGVGGAGQAGRAGAAGSAGAAGNAGAPADGGAGAGGGATCDHVVTTAGCSQLTLVATVQTGLNFVAVDRSHASLYVAGKTSKSVWKIPETDCASAPAPWAAADDGLSVRGLVVGPGDAQVFWVTAATWNSRAVTGGSSVPVVGTQQSNLTSLIVDRDHQNQVISYEQHAMQFQAISTRTPSTPYDLGKTPNPNVPFVVADDGYLYWSTPDGKSQKVNVLATGSSPMNLPDAKMASPRTGFATDGTSLYWLVAMMPMKGMPTSSQLALYRAPLSLTSPQMMTSFDATLDASAYDIQQDPNNVYAIAHTTNRSVLALAKSPPNAAPIALATDVAATALAVDPDPSRHTVYWVTSDGASTSGSVYRCDLK